MSGPTLQQYQSPDAHVEWRREHLGIPYVIAYWRHGQGFGRNSRGGNWNYYILLRERQWRPDDFAKFLRPRRDIPVRPTGAVIRDFDYSSGPLADLDWGHAGGITFYDILGEGNDRTIKAGCDYAHSWNTGNESMALVEFDAQHCIGSLLERFQPLVYCAWSGWFADASEMVPTVTPGRFVHRDHVRDAPEQWFTKEKA